MYVCVLSYILHDWFSIGCYYAALCILLTCRNTQLLLQVFTHPIAVVTLLVLHFTAIHYDATTALHGIHLIASTY
jgi:hypothetical protein